MNDLDAVIAADAREWIERVHSREFPWDDDRYFRDFITSGLALAHQGHDGIPGAPNDLWCARCEADRALDRLIEADHA
jgi:hypothetical protein